MDEPTNRAWRRSKYSVNEVNCVEVANLDGDGHAVRDSKDPSGPALVCSAAQWAVFVAGVRAGELG